MRAVSRTVYGPPEVLELVEVEKPAPKNDEVLICVHAVSLNASDWEILRGKPLYGRIWGFFTPKIRILGSDVAGTVDAIGSTVTRFKVGDAVYGDIFGRWGGFAEWVCVPESMLRLKPDFMSFEQASAVPQSGAIALQGILDDGGTELGKNVLINGAGGCAGTFAVQIAKKHGAEVTGVDNSQKQGLMSQLGADHVIDYTEEDFTKRGERYDLILDLVGHHSVSDFRRALKPNGRYLLVGGAMKLLLGNLFLGSLVSLFGKKQMKMLMLEVNRGLDRLEKMIESGDVIPVIDKCYPLNETPDALRRLGEGKAKGKLVIVNGDRISQAVTPRG